MNHALKLNGLATLEEPRELLDQLAMVINSHEKFCSVLSTTEPDKRQACYDSLRGRLRFEAHPLEVYLAMAGEKAEREQLPYWNPVTSQLSDFQVPEIGKKPEPLQEIAQQAIQQETAEERLRLVCSTCLTISFFFGATKQEAVLSARYAGWFYDANDGEPREICPKCPANRN